MKKARIIAVIVSLFYIFCLIALSLSACTVDNKPVPGEIQSPDNTDVDVSPATSPAEEPDDKCGIQISSFFDKEVYISLSNHNCDFYEDYMFIAPSLYIISKNEIGKENIKITLPIDTLYSVDIKDETQRFRTIKRLFDDEDDGATPEGDFAFEHFLMLQSADWKELARIRNEEVEYAEWFWDRYGEITEWTELDAEAYERQKKSDENDEIMEAYYEAFDQFGENQIPEYFIYKASIRLGEHFEDETVDHIDVKLGEKEYKWSFGEWRFHSKTPDELKGDNYGLRQEQIALLTIGGSAYDNGYALLPNALSFTVGRDELTVTGTEVYGSEIEVLGARVRLESSAGDQISDYYWDMKMPLDFSSSQKVLIDVIVYSDKLREYEIFDTIYLKMLYEVNGNEHSMLVPCYVRRINNPIETYLLAFEGKDFYDYHQYYLPAWYGPSLPVFPESWRKQ